MQRSVIIKANAVKEPRLQRYDIDSVRYCAREFENMSAIWNSNITRLGFGLGKLALIGCETHEPVWSDGG